MGELQAIRKKYRGFEPVLTEQGRRLWATLADELGPVDHLMTGSSASACDHPG